MTSLKTQLERLQHQIKQTECNSRYRYQHQLGRLISQAEERGEIVPSGIRGLNEELMTEAIEAQFDNMPV